MDSFSSLAANWPDLKSGLNLTLMLLLISMGIGLCCAALFTTLSFLSDLFKKIIDGYIFIMRGTPMLVQFYFIYYGLGQFSALHHTWLWSTLFISPFACAILALVLNTTAYTTVILRGALAGVPAGEIAAGQALGLSRGQILRHISLPRALSLILPVYNNEVLMLLKGTSLASTITVLELTGMTEQLIGETYQTLFYWGIAGIIYLAISLAIIGIFKLFGTQVKRVGSNPYHGSF